MWHKTIYAEDIMIQKPKDEIIKEIEIRNRDWHRKMYVNKNGIICRSEKNPIRNDKFTVLYYKDTVNGLQLGGFSPIREQYPIIVRMESVAEGTLVHLEFTRDTILWIAYFLIPMMTIGLAVYIWSVSSQIPGGQVLKWIFSGIAVLSAFSYPQWASKKIKDEAWPGVEVLKDELAKLK